MHPIVIFGACAACAAAFASKEHTHNHPGQSCTEAHPGMSHKEWEELSYGVVGATKKRRGKRGGFWHQEGLPDIAPLTTQDAAMLKAQNLGRRGLPAAYRPYMRPSPGNGGQTVSTVASDGARPPRVMPRQYRPYMRPSPGNGGQTVSTTTGWLQSDRPARIRRGRFSGMDKTDWFKRGKYAVALKEVDPSAVPPPPKRGSWQRAAYDKGVHLALYGVRRLPRRSFAFKPRHSYAFEGTLSSAERRALPAKEFGLPQQRKYPITDRGHAIAAKGRALTAMRDGFIDREQYAKIVRKADRWLKAHGDR